MAYLNQIFTRLNINATNKYIQTEQTTHPIIQYIAIYNANFVDANAETTNELMTQILTFISTNDGDELEANKVEQLKLIGLVQAIEGFGSAFSTTEQGLKVIKSTKSCIIIKQIEGDFRLVCSVSTPENGIKQSAISHQMSHLLQRSYCFFKLANTSFQNILNNYNKDILKNLVNEHWGGFLNNYNSENFKSPNTVKWPNSLNHKGFLGFFPDNTIKKSSIDINYTTKGDIDQFCRHHLSLPQGIIISYFNKQVPKKYGLVYGNVYGSIQQESIPNIYNLLEYYDYHEKLTSDQFTKLNNEDLFSSPPSIKQNINQEIDLDPPGFLDSLNPINLTNALVILPLTSMNTMVNSWLKVPSYLNSVPEPYPVDDSEDANDKGCFIVGLIDGSIRRKLVYLTSVSGQELEYSLVIYNYKDCYITFIYESSVSELDNKDFYVQLQEIMYPIGKEIDSFNMDVETSISSLPKTINTLDEASGLDNDFFFVVYDKSQQQIMTSLPYPPLPINNVKELADINKSSLNIRKAIFYLHDQLLDLFFLENDKFFFTNDSVSEYFHKFNANKINDWMFYYLKYNDKFIIIIKNLNRRRRKHTPATSMVSAGSISQDDVNRGILESLGEDVKLWFDHFRITGDV